MINFNQINNINSTDINDWTISLLSMIREAQQVLLVKIDLYGNGSRLNTIEKLLVYIIYSNANITTHRIAKEIGKSEPTIRRMLAKLRVLKIITIHGSGPKVFHRIAL